MKISKRYCIVLGGAGFIGSHVTESLVGADYHVRVFDDFSSGKEENLNSVKDKIELFIGDIRDRRALSECLEGCETVYHLAAIASVQRSFDEPILAHEVNCTGTLNVLVESIKAGCKRVIFASSSAVYGDAPDQPKREDMTPKPISPYALHKLTSENYLRIFRAFHGLEGFSLRLFNVFGPRQNPSSPYAAVIPIFGKAFSRTESPVIFGDGTQTRDFIEVKEVARAFLLAGQVENASGEAVNIASGKSRSILEVVQEYVRVSGKNIQPVFVPPRSGDILHSTADNSKAKGLLGFSSSQNFFEGLKNYFEWLLKDANA